MVIRTRNCEFCEYKIWPGRGIVYVARDGSSKLYINKKSMNLDKAKTKSHMIRWTTAWRRKNKKLKATGIIKKRRKKKAKLLKSITGMTVDDIRTRRKTNQGGNQEKRKKQIKANKRTNSKNWGGKKQKAMKTHMGGRNR